jgi:hypothetical protein
LQPAGIQTGHGGAIELAKRGDADANGLSHFSASSQWIAAYEAPAGDNRTDKDRGDHNTRMSRNRVREILAAVLMPAWQR